MKKLKMYLTNLINNLKLKSKLVLITCICVVSVLLCALTGLFQIITSYNDTLYKSIANSLKFYIYNVSKCLDTYETLSNGILKNTLIQKSLSAIKDNNTIYMGNYNNVYQQLLSFSNEYQYINYIALSTDKILINVKKTSLIQLEYSKLNEIEANIEDANGKFVWITDYCKNSELILAREIKRIDQVKLDKLATLIIDINIDELLGNSGVSNTYEEFECILIDKNGKAINNTDKFSDDDIEELYQKTSNVDYAILESNGIKYFALCSIEGNNSWGYICLVSYSEIYNQIYKSIINIGIALIFGVSGILIIYNILIRKLVKHFDNLILKFKIFADDPDGMVAIKYNYNKRHDEIGLLHQQFDKMKQKVVDLIYMNYIAELNIKKAQIEMLETQINPHFLYNTLQTINWRAKFLKDKEISIMIESLGKILQMTLSNKDSLITLEQEMDLVQEYITIQQIRTEERLIYKADIPNNLLLSFIPKLIIQPLIENAISHAVDAIQEECKVYFIAESSGKDLVVYVKNNGSSFTDNLLNKLRENEIKTKGHGIGLLNIDTRIKLTYGNEYGLQLFNEDNFAVAKITIPLNYEMDIKIKNS